MKRSYRLKTKTRTIISLALFSLVFVLLLIFYFLNPATSHFFPPCVFYKTTGLYCPGCGTQRAVHAFLHGNFLIAFRYNPLPFMLTGLLTVFYLFNIFRGYKRTPFTGGQSWLVVIIIFAYFLLRNLPFMPFLKP